MGSVEHLYFQSELDDIAEYRPTNLYARKKLAALSQYMAIMNSAMHQKWPNRCYIDLQAGPGKNKIDNDIILGSPLLAMQAPYPVNHFFFNDKDPDVINALQKRVSVSEQASNVTWYCDDVNVIVDDVCQRIGKLNPYSLNLAFLDPVGLEVNWTTVAKLARLRKMDFVILFPTVGIRRSSKNGKRAIDDFFGTNEWRPLYEKALAVKRRQNMIELYLGRLKALGYHFETTDNLQRAEVIAKNLNNVEMYSIIFASKKPLGDILWRQALKYSQPNLQLRFEGW